MKKILTFICFAFLCLALAVEQPAYASEADWNSFVTKFQEKFSSDDSFANWIIDCNSKYTYMNVVRGYNSGTVYLWFTNSLPEIKNLNSGTLKQVSVSGDTGNLRAYNVSTEAWSLATVYLDIQVYGEPGYTYAGSAYYLCSTGTIAGVPAGPFQKYGDLGLIPTQYGSTAINVSAKPLNLIRITMPLNVTATINPNDKDNKVIYSDFYIENKNAAPLSVSLATFTKTSGDFETTILPDGLPSGKTWATLGKADTLKYISAGIKAKSDDSWLSITQTEYLYVGNTSKTKLGTIRGLERANIDFTIVCGQSFAGAKSLMLSAVFIAEVE